MLELFFGELKWSLNLDHGQWAQVLRKTDGFSGADLRNKVFKDVQIVVGARPQRGVPPVVELADVMVGVEGNPPTVDPETRKKLQAAPPSPLLSLRGRAAAPTPTPDPPPLPLGRQAFADKHGTKPLPIPDGPGADHPPPTDVPSLLQAIARHDFGVLGPGESSLAKAGMSAVSAACADHGLPVPEAVQNYKRGPGGRWPPLPDGFRMIEVRPPPPDGSRRHLGVEIRLQGRCPHPPCRHRPRRTGPPRGRLRATRIRSRCRRRCA